MRGPPGTQTTPPPDRKRPWADIEGLVLTLSAKVRRCAGVLAGITAVFVADIATAAFSVDDRELRLVPSELIEWKEHSFEGYTQYNLVEMEEGAAVHAVCDNRAASGLFYRGEIDLDRTPNVEWTWRVDSVPSGFDERTREGDDFAARIYLVDSSSLLPWRTLALNYVWAWGEAEGADWPNPHQGRTHMVAVRSGPPESPGSWRTERRNVKEDFLHLHDREVTKLTAVAIMTDCDDTGERMEAWYGTIRFLP